MSVMVGFLFVREKMSENKEIRFKFEATGLSSEEKKIAKKQFASYRKNYSIDNISDLEILAELVFREALQKRYKQKIEDLADKQKEVIPKHILNTLDQNLEQILILKEKLGLFETQKQSSWLDFWGRFKKKLQIYAQTHKAECTFKCPTCGAYALLLKKIDDCNTFNFNLLRGTFVYNKELMEEIEKGILSKERVAKIIGCSVDYIEGLYNKVYLKEKRQDSKSD